MSPDPDLTMTQPGPHRVKGAFLNLDRRLFEAVAAHHWPGGDRVLPRLSRAADHGLLWCATAAALGLTRAPGARRAALRGVASLGLASLTINTLGKRTVRRPRPLLDPVPHVRRLPRQPTTTSFPSGHAASAAAFAAGVSMESPRWGAAVALPAGAVALSRVYTGVHFPSDVLAGTALGVGAAWIARRLMPTLVESVRPAASRAEAPTVRRGAGLVMVANTSSGTSTRIRAVRDELPEARIVTCGPDDIREELERAAKHARVLGVCGGDGTVNTAAEVALESGLPLAVLPGGTLNHFAQDLGVRDARDLRRALESGSAVRVDVGEFVGDDRRGVFLNTFSLGVYPELVRERERWSGRIGEWPAGVLAAVRVLRADRHPVEAGIGGRRRPLWLLFAGNGTYHRMGLSPGRRLDLADGRLDVRVVRGGRRPATRLLSAALAGPLTRSPAHTAVTTGRLRLTDLAAGTLLAYDGEVRETRGDLTLRKLPEALTVYRPPTGDVS
ncbi:phosphatase PAP2 family protein [Streptomyces sp. HSG2]|uniref:bifunctional phosphatase PAP2/diacylglycerol kinase family protein n=1 Tax=Streptomyces sp. HSG2 TaxID=2797167 RepID=UPI001904F6D0|nr:phosphatase PAP2 family protein [Streptomyces sp. HSG2]